MKTYQVSSARCQVKATANSRQGGLEIGDLGSEICNPASLPYPRGMSLIEVLAAIGVLTIGLLGLAALLPVGRFTINEAAKADRTGDCGRAALRDVVVRRMLDFHHWIGPPPQNQYVDNQNFNSNKPWYDQNGNPENLPLSFLIDPRGVTYGMGSNFGNIPAGVPRINLDYVGNSTAVANQIFVWPDDLIVNLPEDMNPPRPVGRPITVDGNNNPVPMTNSGDYSWFASVVPAPNNPLRFTVSIVVCCKRDLTSTAERAVVVEAFFDNGLGGGSLQLNREINDIGSDNPPAGIAVKENDWVAMCSPSGLCRWYRIGSIGDNSSYLTLIGPDWTATPGQDKLVALGQSVIGVYTTTVELDTDPTWTN